MPALHLDAAIVHTNRADAAGNGQILEPRRVLRPALPRRGRAPLHDHRGIVENGTLADDGARSPSVPIHRMLVDGVAETPGGAHFTANPPDYGRDEKFQKEYAASAADPAEWEAFAKRYVFVGDDEYRAHVAGTAGAAR